MITRLRIANFQSHSDTVMLPSSGTNVIVGRNMVGKSSILRALRLVLFNKPDGSEFVRWGEDNATIEVEYNDHIIKRIKGKDNIYVADDSTFANFGKSIPKEVIDILGFSSIIVDREILELHFDNPHTAPFLVSETDAVKGKILSSLGEAVVAELMLFDKAISRANSRIRELAGEHLLVTNNKATATDELAKYASLNNLFIDVKTCSSLLNELEQEQKEVVSLSAIKVNLDTCDPYIIYYQQLINSTVNVATIEDKLLRINVLQNELWTLIDIQQDLERISIEILHLECSVACVSELPNLDTINEMLQVLEQLVILSRDLSVLDQQITHSTRITIPKLQESLQQVVSEYIGLLKLEGICPICEQPIDEHTLDQILSEITNEQ